MDLSDEQFMNIVEKADVIFDKLLNKLTLKEYKELIKEIENLTIERQITNKILLDRIIYLKAKKKSKKITTNFNSNDELKFPDSFELINYDTIKKINDPISYFSSGELELINNL